MPEPYLGHKRNINFNCLFNGLPSPLRVERPDDLKSLKKLSHLSRLLGGIIQPHNIRHLFRRVFFLHGSKEGSLGTRG